MIRFASVELDKWLTHSNRKPLIIRGARQVGKTWLVRDLARRHGLNLIELNFEKMPVLADLFSGNDPTEILGNIEGETGMKIDLHQSLLFLDEIQAAPAILAKLRWFKEEMSTLPVIAAGSLLEFALGEFRHSMPVGRITYFYLEPFSFLEFLHAAGNIPLYEQLISFHLEKPLPASLHEKCLKLYCEYCLIGGMPEVVQSWMSEKDAKGCLKIQQDLLNTYRDDFHKYGGSIDPLVLSRIMQSVCQQLGNKFIYSRVDPQLKVYLIKNAFHLLCMAKICHKVLYTTGNGLPLGVESNEKFFKALMLDTGLISAHLGMSSMKSIDVRELIFANKGGLAEQFAAQQLRAAQAPLEEPCLFYWQRTGGRQAEIDYVIQHGNNIIPVEIKSGAAGSMKSLHQFMFEKDLGLAVRCNTNLPSVEQIEVKTTLGDSVSYRLISIPVFLVERIHEIIGGMG